MKIYFFRGLPASGKSTRRREMMADQSYHPIMYTNKDEIRFQVVGFDAWSKNAEKEVERRETAAIENGCKEGFNVIIDNTHGHPKHEALYREIANRFDYEFEIVNFDTPLDECIRRDALRGSESVGEEVIRKMHRRFFMPTYDPDPSLPPAIIVDLDGTLATATDRSWYEYSKCGSDKLVKPVMDLIEAMWMAKKIKHVILLTGRDETGRAATEEWLLEVPVIRLGDEVRLIMKAAGDNRPDNVTKHEAFEKYIRPNFRILFVLEDRRRVVNMWREIGLTCFEVAVHHERERSIH